MKRLVGILLTVAGALGVTVLSFTASVVAQNYGSGTYGSCAYGSCPISVVSGGSVDLPVTPTGAGVCTVASDTVGVSTNSSVGYNLKISSDSTQVALVSGSNQLSATSGTSAAPAALVMNSWGYRVDSGVFGSGPTSAQQNAAIPSVSFAAMPNADNAATLVSYSSMRPSPDNTTVWFAACANTSQPVGTYTGTVVYTAVVNP